MHILHYVDKLIFASMHSSSNYAFDNGYLCVLVIAYEEEFVAFYF